MEIVEFEISMGAKVKDSITGFSGIVTWRCQYITGCLQYGVTPKAKGGVAAKCVAFDEDRLVGGRKVKKVKKSKRPTGGPQAFQPPSK